MDSTDMALISHHSLHRPSLQIGLGSLPPPDDFSTHPAAGKLVITDLPDREH